MRARCQVLIRFCGLGVGLLVAALLTACRSDDSNLINPADPWVPPGLIGSQTNGTNAASTLLSDNSLLVSGRLMRIGEKITVTFSDLPPPGLREHEQRIREDGTITLPFNVTVHAAGKTAGQLEEEIRNKYVPRLYLRMTVTVRTEERFFYVGGEVKIAARQPYLGQMTILRAVQSAGDFTDFANRKRIELIRASGEHFMVNWYKAIKNPELDLEVFPGDTIIVHRRWF